MGWANCGTDSNGRQIGYAHLATCDFPGCKAKIHRGLSYACGGMHGDGDPDYSCDGYFCTEHQKWSEKADRLLCVACAKAADATLPQHDRDCPLHEIAEHDCAYNLMLCSCEAEK